MNKSDEAREANQRIADAAARLDFVSRIPLICECSDPVCTAVVMISRKDYQAIRADPTLYLTVPEHHVDAAVPGETTSNYWVQRCA